METYDIYYDNYMTKLNPETATFSVQRDDLKTFLESSFEGMVILSYYEKHKSLSDRQMTTLTQLIISREITELFKQKKVSLQNPLKKLAIPSETLVQQAKEVSELFNEHSGIFYTPSRSDKDNRVGPTGKFVSRVNYVRQVLVEAGLLENSSQKVETKIDTGNTVDCLDILRKTCENWEDIQESWNQTYLARQELAKNKKGGPIWQFSEFPCLQEQRGSELINADFMAKFPDFKDVSYIWPLFKTALTKFVNSKLLLDEDPMKLQDLLNYTAPDQQDIILLMILPEALKARTVINTGRIQKDCKRRKLETEEEKESKRNDRDTLIIHVDEIKNVNEIIQNKQDYYKSKEQDITPYMLIVGPVNQPDAYFTVVDNVRYICNSLPQTIELTIKIFLGQKIPYPKQTQQVWTLLQKVYMNVSTPADKLLSATNKALSFFQKELGSCET